MPLSIVKENPDSIDPQDRRWIAAFLRGDPTAVATIQRWLEEGVQGFRRRLAMPWEDVRQDLLTEATLQLQRGAFRGESRLRTYLWRIAKYRCLNRLRQERRLREAPLEDAVIEGAAAPGPSPFQQLADHQSADLLRRLMAVMPGPCRQLWSRILAGQSYREMSEALGVSAGALRVRVARCRKKAVDLWNQDDPSGNRRE
jgi:RNA polymerase sigma factor (sigma-70 family)